MKEFRHDTTVGDIVRHSPGLARVFERLEIDYCCGGKVPLAEACHRQSQDPDTVLTMLADEFKRIDKPAHHDVSAMSLTELADHIEQTHHTYLRSELPRLDGMTRKVASVHGERDPRLIEVRDTFAALAAELTQHMMKEERILFPMIRALDGGDTSAAGHCGSIAAPINQMESEHAQAGDGLSRLKNLTDRFTPPEWACNTYRALLDGLRHFEHDLHLHIHKENNVLFPAALKREKQIPANR